jgi:ABC-type sulfate/molybdate transport systems ATPase subunit
MTALLPSTTFLEDFMSNVSYIIKSNHHMFPITLGHHTFLHLSPPGAGKTTLLRLIAGQESHDTGALTRNNGATVGYLTQVGLGALH